MTDGRAPNVDLSAGDDAGLPAGAETVNGLGRDPQPKTGADDAASLGQRGTHLARGPGEGGAIRTESAGRYVMSRPVRRRTGGTCLD
jgi:hypothetical protein